MANDKVFDSNLNPTKLTVRSHKPYSIPDIVGKAAKKEEEAEEVFNYTLKITAGDGMGEERASKIRHEITKRGGKFYCTGETGKDGHASMKDALAHGAALQAKDLIK